MKKLLCVVVLSVSTLNLCMEPETGEISIALANMALDEIASVVKDVAHDVQISMFGTTVEVGEYIEETVNDDFDHCTVS